MADPYLPPSAPLDPARSRRGPVMPLCPHCGKASVSRGWFARWGGLLGPALFNAVRCGGCRTLFNGRTGVAISGAMLVYQLIALAVCAAIAVAYVSLRR